MTVRIMINNYHFMHLVLEELKKVYLNNENKIKVYYNNKNIIGPLQRSLHDKKKKIF